MIYDSNITNVNESDITSLLESVEDRFENYTILEANAILVGEQETNWTRFMQGVGMSELATIMEGEQVIYEGARLEGFIKKAKAFFQAALNKLAEITKSFVAKIMQLVPGNDAFLKKYEKDLLKMSVPPKFEFKGYAFPNMGKPSYNIKTAGSQNITFGPGGNVDSILNNKDNYSKESAEANFVPNKGDSFHESLFIHFYGGKEKVQLTINIKDQIDNMKDTKKIKKEATDSYKEAAKQIKDIIKKLDSAEKEFKKDNKETVAAASKVESAFNVLLSYWKAYANAAQITHGTYLSALGARNRQAKAICTKLIVADNKSKGKEKRKEIKAKNEGFVNTDAFLGAVEFI